MNIQMKIVVSQSQKIRQLIDSGKYTEALIRATRLWDAIDGKPSHPEYLWCIMSGIVPEVFVDPRDLNSIKFVRPSWICTWGKRSTVVTATNRLKAAWYAHDDLARGRVIDLAEIDVQRLS